MRKFFDNEKLTHFECTAKELATEVGVVKDYASKFLIFLSHMGLVETLGQRKQEGAGKPAYLFRVPKKLNIDFDFLLEFVTDDSNEDEWKAEMLKLGFSEEDLISLKEVNDTDADS